MGASGQYTWGSTYVARRDISACVTTRGITYRCWRMDGQRSASVGQPSTDLVVALWSTRPEIASLFENPALLVPSDGL